MAFSSNHGDTEEMSEINMTPFVDVMLVLLIIFMITVPVLTQTVEIELPTIGSSSSTITPESIALSVDRDGGIFWNEQAIDHAALSSRLKEVATQQPQPPIIIRGDKKTDYEHVVKLMASAQQAGLTQLGFVTELGE